MNRPRLTGDRNQCAGCGSLFNSTRAFDMHRAGEFGVGRRCLTEAEMLAKGMVIGADAFWRGSAMPADVLARKIMKEAA